MGEAVARCPAGDLTDREVGQPPQFVALRPGEMRGDDRVVAVPQRMVRLQRVGVGDVDHRADAVRPQYVGEGVLVDDGAP